MIFSIRSRVGPPHINQFPVSTYHLNFSIDRLLPGVDNVRHDVYLSPGFINAARKAISQLIAKHFNMSRLFPIDQPVDLSKKKHEFKELYRIVMEDAVHRSKLFNEPQIDSLAVAATIGMLVEETRKHFARMTGQIKNMIRKYERTDRHDLEETIKTKEALSNVIQNRHTIMRNVGLELFDMMSEVHRNELRPMREANFGSDAMLPDNVLDNPVFHTDNPYNDSFLLEAYDVIFGRRVEDPDKYDTLMAHIRRLMNLICRREGPAEETADDAQAAEAFDIDGLIKHTDNLRLLIDWYAAKALVKKAKTSNQTQDAIDQLKQRMQHQKRMLNLFYREFNKAGLVDRFAASYEMRSVYKDYCPPLVPQQILQFMIEPKSRKAIVRRLKRLRKLYNQPFDLRPLKKKIKRLSMLTRRDKKIHLIRFLKGMVRYHRDLENFKTFKEAIERINLTTDEKIINLSRANHTLYEFLLPHEQTQDEKPIINHVIIKADLRGSTDITHRMHQKGLNPASYFSLNFFNPITDILNTYGAVKVFIEGDAIILCIMERENSPGGWYGVARACGLAINMLHIIKRYNQKNLKNQLPVLELGIGINYRNEPPTFLFDGDQRIMISSAINLADRQSGCSKPIRNMLKGKKTPFNLYVFQGIDETAHQKTSDDLLLRSNVNGIELNAAGFAKLQKEIRLMEMTCSIPELQPGTIKLFTGKFPSTTGRYQRLIIREDDIRRIDTATFDITGLAALKYYEVCTHPKVYQYVRKRL